MTMRPFAKTAAWRGMPVALAVAAGCVAVVSAPSTGGANWLSKIVREAGEAGGKGGGKLGHGHGLGAFDDAALHVRSLPAPSGGGVALAAHATPEGHWKFVNKAGEVYTAGTPDEMTRVMAALAPEAGADRRLALFLSDETVFGQRALLKELPADATLNVVVGKSSYPLLRRAEAGGERIYAEVRPNVAVVMTGRKVVVEALYQLSRPLEASRVRVLSLTPGGPDALKTVPRFDPATKSALVDEIDPNSLARALSGLKGQTAVLSGRIEAGQLRFQPASGADRTLPMAELERAAAAADVNLVVLQSAAARQPGGRNWLWQKVEVSGLKDAMQRPTFADFLNGLGAGRGAFLVDVTSSAEGRTALRAVPSGPKGDPLTAPITGPLGEWLSETVSNVTGNVVTSAVEVMAKSEERQRELDARLIPGIPSLVQIGYFGAMVSGLLGLGVARRWWGRLWPAENRAEYAGALGYHAARMARLSAFVLAFLPLAGPFAFITAVVMQLWDVVTAPVRFGRWIAGRIRGSGRAAAQ